MTMPARFGEPHRPKRSLSARCRRGNADPGVNHFRNDRTLPPDQNRQDHGLDRRRHAARRSQGRATIARLR